MTLPAYRLLILCLLVSLCGGCTKQPAPQDTETPSPEAATDIPSAAPETPAPATPEPTPFDLSAVKWIVVGDSITEKNPTAQISYYDFVAKDFGCEVVNYGRSATGYMVPGSHETFYERIDEIDFTDADVITLFGSFNDLGRGFAFGTAEDEGTDTIGGCMNRTIENIRAKAPDIKIGIATPTPWNLGAGYSSATDSMMDAGISKEEFDQYAALLMQVAQRHEIPVLDLYHAGLFNPDSAEDRAAYFNENGLQDPGVHPNSMGHSLMAPLWKDFLLGLLGQK